MTDISAPEHGAVGCKFGKPGAGGNDTEVFYFSESGNFVGHSRRDGIGEESPHRRAIAAIALETLTIQGVMTSSSERIHIVESPDHFLVSPELANLLNR